MDGLALAGLVLLVAGGALGLAWVAHRLRRSSGAADAITQIVSVEDGGDTFWTVETQYFAGKPRGVREGRIVARSLADGTSLRRREAHEKLVVLATDDRGLLCAGPDLHVRERQGLQIVAGALVQGAAPIEALAPELVDGTLTVRDDTGRRVRVGRATALRPTFRPQSAFASCRVSGHPRTRIERHGRDLGEYLAPRFLGDVDGDILLLAQRTLGSDEVELHRVGNRGAVFATQLGRPAAAIGQAVRAGSLLVLELRDPLELAAIDLTTGALRWRVLA